MRNIKEIKKLNDFGSISKIVRLISKSISDGKISDSSLFFWSIYINI